MRNPWLNVVMLVALAAPSACHDGTSLRTVPVDARPPDADQAFWSWFVENAAALRADKDLERTMTRITTAVEKEHPGVFAEIGGDGADRTLVLSVDGIKKLFPLVKRLYAARPTVAGWTIVAFRQRAGPGRMDEIEMNGRTFDPNAIRFVATKAGDELSLSVFVPGFTSVKAFGPVLFIALDHAVGEYDMETRIGEIEWAGLDRAPATARPLAELPAMIDSSFPVSP